MGRVLIAARLADRKENVHRKALIRHADGHVTGPLGPRSRRRVRPPSTGKRSTSPPCAAHWQQGAAFGLRRLVGNLFPLFLAQRLRRQSQDGDRVATA